MTCATTWRKNRLYLVVQRFAVTDLSPEYVTNHDMGQAFEELLRKFNDVSLLVYHG